MSLFNPRDGGGGEEGGGGFFTLLTITPSGTVDLGSVVLGSNATATFILTNVGPVNAVISNVTTPSVEWLLPGLFALPQTVVPGASISFVVEFQPLALGAHTADLTVTWSPAQYTGVTVVHLTANAISAGTHQAAFNPAALTFSTIQIGTNETLTVLFENVGSGAIALNSLTLSSGVDYSILTALGFPLAIPAGNSQAIDIKFTPTVVGDLVDTLVAVTDTAGTINLAIQGGCVLILAIAVCGENKRRLLVGGYDASNSTNKPAPLLVSPDSFDSDQPGAIVFNGSLWEGLGAEKTLHRLGFYYENLGQTSLSGTVTVFRPSLGADGVQVVAFTLALGTALADGSTRYAEVDAIATGEILTLALARATASGAVSICAVVPYFEPRGEKVRDS